VGSLAGSDGSADATGPGGDEGFDEASLAGSETLDMKPSVAEHPDAAATKLVSTAVQHPAVQPAVRCTLPRYRLIGGLPRERPRTPRGCPVLPG
jgi:hypothetical protein